MQPIVLLTGLMGFDSFLFWRMFKGVPELLAQRGIPCVFPIVHPAISIAERAREQIALIDSVIGPQARFHIIAHSLGGLNARYIASPGGLAQGHRVISVTTLATPHYGSPAAERVPVTLRWLVGASAKLAAPLMPRKVDRRYLRYLAQQRWEALDELAPRYLQQCFNPTVPNDPRVRYFSYAADVTLQGSGLVASARRRMGKIWGVAADGPHDGLVSVSSARWGEFLGTVPTDHAGIIGLSPLPGRSPGYDHLSLFAEIADRVSNLPAVGNC